MAALALRLSMVVVCCVWGEAFQVIRDDLVLPWAIPPVLAERPFSDNGSSMVVLEASLAPVDPSTPLDIWMCAGMWGSGGQGLPSVDVWHVRASGAHNNGYTNHHRPSGSNNNSSRASSSPESCDC